VGGRTTDRRVARGRTPGARALFRAGCPVTHNAAMNDTAAGGGEGRSRARRLVEIAEEECLRLLNTTDLGRLAVVRDGRPEIFPVNYGLDGRTVVLSTNPGAKLEGATLGWVAFEVDHFDPLAVTGWDVVVRGIGRRRRIGSPALAGARAVDRGGEGPPDRHHAPGVLGPAARDVGWGSSPWRSDLTAP